ncbi:hypothetical protein HS5_12120 [Acidianus sp. HS-5]|nr:hypothetical protein HS5_12120 [Acidianus sp. HS-5]
MRQVGPNIPLISRILRTEENSLRRQLLKIRNLSFTPVYSSSIIKINFDGIPVRRSIKSNLSLSLSLKEGLKIKEFTNYSGIPEYYDEKYNTWITTLDRRAEGLKVDIKYSSETQPLFFSSLRSFSSFNEILKGMYNKTLIESFIIDYGNKDVVFDILYTSKEVLDLLELLPFIRFSVITELDSDELYITELTLPFNYLNYVSELLSDLKSEIDMIFTLNKLPYISKII